jgi:hypothetical protein
MESAAVHYDERIPCSDALRREQHFRGRRPLSTRCSNQRMKIEKLFYKSAEVRMHIQCGRRDSAPSRT